MPKKIEAKIIADSINPWGDRITTMILTFPRFILPELNTHRVFSKNSASSRAVPFKKMLEMVKEDPFIPIAWMKDHKGMQGKQFFDPNETFTSTNPLDRFASGITDKDSPTKVIVDRLKFEWLWARDMAVQAASNLNNMGVHYHPNGDKSKLTGEGVGLTKQLCNRLLEPFMWHTVLLTGTDFENFFELRCPCYVFNYYPEDRPEALEPSSKSFKSKKDLIEWANVNNYYVGTSQQINSYEFWAKMNCSQAEIHMQELAESMWDIYNAAKPKLLNVGEWHIPFGDKLDSTEIYNKLMAPSNFDYNQGRIDLIKAAIATARCARLSYMTMDSKIDFDKDIVLHNRLLEDKHFSPFEHIARCVSEKELDDYILIENEETVVGKCKNFTGFIQYRKLVEDDRNRIFNK